MTLRNGHGTGAGIPRIEVLPADEQPVGVPDLTRDHVTAEPPGARHRTGQFTAGSDITRRRASEGGKARAARARQLRALRGLGLHGDAPEALRPYLEDGDAFVASEVARMARDCGGGVCPPNASILIQQAGLAAAGSRAAYATGDVLTGARLGAEVRSCLLGARELCVREAETRAKGETAKNGGRPPIPARFLVNGGKP